MIHVVYAMAVLAVTILGVLMLHRAQMKIDRLDHDLALERIALVSEKSSHGQTRSYLADVERACHRLGQDVFHLNIRQLVDDRRFAVTLEMDRLGLNELRYEGREIQVRMLGERLFLEMERCAMKIGGNSPWWKEPAIAPREP